MPVGAQRDAAECVLIVMDQDIHIVTDSSCDLPRHLAKQLEISVVPLSVHFGAEAYDETDLPIELFWEKAAGPYPPQTSQPSVGAFEECFEQMLARGKQVLCLTLTQKHSGTFNAARLAAQRFGEAVSVLDSLSISLGLGVQAFLAARTARAGRSMQQILDLLKSLQARMRLTIVLDTLENLRRGGRADGFIAVAERMTRALNIKPVISMVEGQLRLLGAARSFQGGLRRVVDQVERLGPLEHLAVVHTRIQDVAEEVADRLAQRAAFPRERIWLRETGAALACHGGSGVLGVMAVPEDPSA